MLASMNHVTALLLFATGSAFALNWPEWRGPHRTGITGDTNLPIHWSTNENVRWRTPLPAPGNSTPIVWGNRVFITQAVEARSAGPSTSKASREGSRRSVLCLDRRNGKVLWESGVNAAADELTHQDNPY